MGCIIGCARQPKIGIESSEHEINSSERENNQVQASMTMGKGGKRFQNDNQNIKELQESLEKLENQVVELQDQLEMKEQVIKFLQLQILEKKMSGATCDTDNLIQVCGTETVTDDSLSSDEKESLIKKN